MNRTGFLLGATFKSKQFIPYVEQPDENKNSIIPSRSGYDMSAPRPRMDMSDPNTTSEKLRKLTETASLTFDVLDPTDTKFVAEGRNQRMIKRSILPSSIPNLSAVDMKAFVDQMEVNNTARSADMKASLVIVQLSLIRRIKTSSEKTITDIIKSLEVVGKGVSIDNVGRYVFPWTITENKQGLKTDLKPEGSTLRPDVVMKLIQNRNMWSRTNGYAHQSSSFGNFLKNIIDFGDMKDNSTTIIDTEDVVWHELDGKSDKDAYDDMLSYALEDFKYFSSVNMIKVDPYFTQLNEKYKDIFKVDNQELIDY